MCLSRGEPGVFPCYAKHISRLPADPLCCFSQLPRQRAPCLWLIFPVQGGLRTSRPKALVSNNQKKKARRDATACSSPLSHEQKPGRFLLWRASVKWSWQGPSAWWEVLLQVVHIGLVLQSFTSKSYSCDSSDLWKHPDTLTCFPLESGSSPALQSTVQPPT